MMKDKYESLSLSALKDLAKVRGIKGISGMKKKELVEAMLVQDDKDAQANPDVQKENSDEEVHRVEPAKPEKETAKKDPDALPSDKEALDSGISANGWRSCRMAMDSSVVRIICQVKMMFMWRRARYAVLI